MIAEEAKSALRRLMESRTKRDELKKALEIAEREFRDNEADVFEALEALRDPNDPSASRTALKVHLGEPWGTVSFRGRETIYGRIIDDEAALEYFEQRGMMDEVTEPKFAKARLNEIARECIEQGEQTPPGMDYHRQCGVTITRQKG